MGMLLGYCVFGLGSTGGSKVSMEGGSCLEFWVDKARRVGKGPCGRSAMRSESTRGLGSTGLE